MKIHKTLAARFGANLAREREMRGLTTRQMGDLLGISHIYVQYLENGDRTPTLPMVEQISVKLKKHALDMLK
jgi:transcriptional regulator with XRE-family HTH domain